MGRREFVVADVHCGWCLKPYQDLLRLLAHLRACHPQAVTRPEFGEVAVGGGA